MLHVILIRSDLLSNRIDRVLRVVRSLPFQPCPEGNTSGEWGVYIRDKCIETGDSHDIDRGEAISL